MDKKAQDFWNYVMTYSTLVVGIIILILFILLIIVNVKAYPDMNITPNPFNISGYEGDINYFNITIHNNGTDIAYNITGLPVQDIIFSQIDQLNKNETKNMTIKMLSASVYTATRITPIQFYYKTINSYQPKSYKINISDNGFSPPNITIRQNDVITFANIGILNHTITDLNGIFPEIMLPPNATQNMTFQNTGLTAYYDRISGRGGYINTLTNQDLFYTHSSLLDDSLTLNIKSNYKPSNLSFVDVAPENYTLNYDQSNIGTLILNSQNDLYNVHLSGEWFTFNDNNFNTQANLNKVVAFTITPHNINETGMTNQTYTEYINISADNLNYSQLPVHVFINFYDFGEYHNGTYVFNTVSLDVNGSLQFCHDNRNNTLCKDFIVEVPTYIEKNWSFNMSEAEYLAEKQKEQDSADRLTRMENTLATTQSKIDGYTNSINGEVENVRNTSEIIRLEIQSVRQYIQDEQSKQQNWDNFKLAVEIIFTLVLLGSTITFFAWRYLRSREHLIQ